MNDDVRSAARRVVAAWVSTRPAWVQEVSAAVLALDAALKAQAEPAQEPVAWATEIIDALQAQYDTEMIKENDSGDALIRLDDAIAAVEDAEKHYTAPPQRLPLTDEEILYIYNQLPNWGMGMDSLPQGLEKFARAIERKVRGEKE